MKPHLILLATATFVLAALPTQSTALDFDFAKIVDTDTPIPVRLGELHRLRLFRVRWRQRGVRWHRLRLSHTKDITMNRRTLRTLRIAAVLTAVIFGSFSGLNANVPIYPTGVNDNYQLLAGGTPDPHYQISAGLNNGNQGVVLSNLWPAWYQPADAKWIFVENSLSERGSFNMQTTFDLTGYDPGTAMIVGKWSAG